MEEWILKANLNLIQKKMSKAEEYTSKISEELLQKLSPEESEKIEKRMLLAAKIDDALKAKGWKKKDFADSLSKQPSEITKWLSGTHNFTTDTLWDIERILGVELITLEERRKEQVISFHISVNKDAEIEAPMGCEQLFYGNVYTMSSTWQKKLTKDQKRTNEIYQA